MSDNRGLAGQLRHGLSRPEQAFYNKLNCEGRSDRTRGYSLSELDHSIDARQVLTCCLIKPNQPAMVAEALTLVGLNFPQSREGAGKRVGEGAKRRMGEAGNTALVQSVRLDAGNALNSSSLPRGCAPRRCAHSPFRRFAQSPTDSWLLKVLGRDRLMRSGHAPTSNQID